MNKRNHRWVFGFGYAYSYFYKRDFSFEFPVADEADNYSDLKLFTTKASYQTNFGKDNRFRFEIGLNTLLPISYRHRTNGLDETMRIWETDGIPLPYPLINVAYAFGK